MPYLIVTLNSETLRRERMDKIQKAILKWAKQCKRTRQYMHAFDDWLRAAPKLPLPELTVENAQQIILNSWKSQVK